MFLCAGCSPSCVFVISDWLFVTPVVPVTEHNMLQSEMCCLQLDDGYVLGLLSTFAE